tara:strand:+ start:108 stop:539 length:432 start_codon:yes stop_codon:yes gene_type:complete
MKKYINYIGLLTLIVFFTNCDDKSSTESTVDPLVGVWVWTSTTMTDGIETISESPSTGNTETIILNEDGSCSYIGQNPEGSYTGSGTWSTNGNKLTLIVTFSGESTSNTLIMDYSISGSVLTGIVINTYDGVQVTTTYLYIKS